MPRVPMRQSRQSQHSQSQQQSQQQDRSQSQNNNTQFQSRRFPVQDAENSIPFYNARLFSMYESLIQSYTHFTYHANHMYNVLEQSLHGTRNTINSNPYPWLLIPHPSNQAPQPQHQAPQHQAPQHQAPHPSNQVPQNQAHRQAPQPRTMPSSSTSRTTRAPPPPSRSTETSIINALFGIINPPEEPRLTHAQLNERVETIIFGNIVNPINNVCSITQDSFEDTQQVTRIRHCGHIFNSDSLAHWLRMNNTCPTCRYNLLTDHTHSYASAATATATAPTATAPTATATATATAPTATAPTATAPTATTAPTADAPTNERATVRRIQIPIESDININTFYNELMRTSGNIPGFELNSMNDDSIIFSFDLMGARGSGSNGSGPSRGPGRIDDVD